VDKKSSSILKIFIWSIIALFLISILISGITFKSMDIFTIHIGSNHYLNSSSYSSGNNEVDASDISNIEINWIDGSVNIESYDGDIIKFYEESSKDLDEKNQLHYYSDGNKLTIEYSASNKIPISIGNFGNHKSLTVQIPEAIMEQLKNLSVDAVSSDVNIKNINADYVNLDNLSGKFILKNLTVDDIDIDTASGNIESDNITVKRTSNMNTISGNASLNGSINAIDFDSTSGDLKVNSDICPNEVETDTTSGKVELSIPDNDGFTYSHDGVSGEIKCDFPVSFEKGEGKYGNEEAEFSFDTISGDVYIYKNNS